VLSSNIVQRRWFSRAGLVALVLASGSAVALPARADAPSDHEAAVASFREGRRLIDAGDCPGALAHLETSLRHEPSVGARLSTAECVEKTDPLRAWRTLDAAVLLAYTSHDDRLAVTEQRVADLERVLPVFHIALAPSDLDRPGTEVSVDGRVIDRVHLRRGVVAVEPGPHTIEVRAPERALWSRRIDAPPPGSVVEIAVRLVAADPPLSSPPPPRSAGTGASDARSARRTAGLAIGGTGLVALGVGTVFGALAFDKRGDLDMVCGGSRSSCTANPAEITPLRENASTLAAVSTTSFIVGGVALASGLALYLVSIGEARR